MENTLYLKVSFDKKKNMKLNEDITFCMYKRSILLLNAKKNYTQN